MARRRRRGGTGLAELIYDPIGAYFDGSFQPGAYGGHQTHVHFASANPGVDLALIRLARRLGLTVGENPYTTGQRETSGHTEGSWHYRNFGRQFGGRTLGMAGDVSGDPTAMARFFRKAARRYGNGVASSAPLGGGGGGGGGGGMPAQQPISLSPRALTYAKPGAVLSQFAPLPSLGLEPAMAGLQETTESESLARAMRSIREGLLSA